MPGKGMIQRKREQHKIDRNARLARNTEDGFSTYKSMGMTAKDAFRAITQRISWLNDKIAWCQVNDMKFSLYVREREALLWMMDKVKELSSELLALKADTKGKGEML